MGFGSFMTNLYHKTVNVASGTINGIASFVPKAGQTVFNTLKNGITTITDEPAKAISALSNGISTAYNNTQKNIDTILNTPTKIIGSFENTAKEIIPEVASTLGTPLLIGAGVAGLIALSILKR